MYFIYLLNAITNAQPSDIAAKINKLKYGIVSVINQIFVAGM